MSRQQLDTQVRKGVLVRVWSGVYPTRKPTMADRLAARARQLPRPRALATLDAAEYESVEWHVGRDEMLRDKKRFAGIQEAGRIASRRALSGRR
ncbi:hypothetical protein MHPYR_420021 [uncultured Mycobacterium sp.]|uniref:Uncharacterized protein n=1 Tax=uncultured Mycobacterium sp. TaxID=171292 RepID=A0A1Y5PF91_9MYCO|nr:hypothetical protein MHPYR_420021 [uncultured Mycobacterium sp.]